MQLPTRSSHLSPWFYSFVLISLFLCLVTFSISELPRAFRIFSLRNESNFAALFSGMFLLVIALHAYDGWSLNRSSRPQVAFAWLALSFVLIALSFDEIGSLHERVSMLRRLITEGTAAAPESGSVPQALRVSRYWWSLLPFGVIILGAAAYAVSTIWRSTTERRTAILICLGFALFASVALQEYIEHTVDWSANRYLRFFRRWFRPVIEEGTELLGMSVLLYASMSNTRGIIGGGERSDFPVLEAIVRWRRAILVIGLIAAPLISFVTVSMPAEGHDNGMPPDWPAAALFSLGALAAARPFFISGRGVGWPGWALVALGLVGCASTILPPASAAAVPLTAGVVGAAFLIWVLSANYPSSAYLPAGVILSIVFATTWVLGNNDFVVYTLIQYAALAFYWVSSSTTLEPGGPAAEAS